MRILVTGGLGFIGSALIRRMIRRTDFEVLCFDAMTYAAIPEALEECQASPRYHFTRGDIRDAAQISAALEAFQPDIVMHLAAESHVDRSIDGPDAFIQTNVVGTTNMLQASRKYFDTLDPTRQACFRFQHISTDEVFGSLALDDPRFEESTRYDPRSPYSASKAASDHFVRAWSETFKLPVVISNCSNNYGPWQFPEKMIPVMIAKGHDRQPMPVYGRGENIRDWLHVDDHAEALIAIATRGHLGESYNVGGNAEHTNLAVVKAICAALDERRPEHAPHENLITFVTDRPGHDFRYAINAGKIERELGWTPRRTFENGLRETVNWYLDNESWWRGVLNRIGGARRLGLAPEGTAA